MDSIKEAFQKVKEDMDFLYNELNNLKIEVGQSHNEISQIAEILNQISEKLTQKQSEEASTHKAQKTTTPTHPSTHNYPLEALKPQNMPISTGNGGVSTDRQTDRQQGNRQEIRPKIPPKRDDNSIEDAARILDSLDSIKKEIRLKFKRLTDQEILVFSTLYQIDEEMGPTDYKTLAVRLNLTESSIRDYIGRLIKKGIPVDKKRINNKTIQLSISQNLKKIASLATILQLRDI